MDYGKLSTTIDKKLKKSIDLVLNPEVDPETRRFNLEILLREVGDRVYEVVYAMNAYDMEIEYTDGVGQGDHYYGLAKNLSDSISLGGREDVEAQLDLWLQDVIHKAQYDAFSVAAESGKYRVVTRTERADCCAWCRAHVGTFVEPSSEVFAQHDHCKGSILTEGWKSHNGVLTGKGWKEFRER